MVIRSKGIRPYIVRLDEPDPSLSFDRNNVFGLTGGFPGDPASYVNDYGVSLVDALYAMNIPDAGDVMFENAYDMSNWMLGWHVETVLLPDGSIYIEYADGRARGKAEYVSWKNGLTSNVAFYDDPSIREPLADNVVVRGRQNVPAGAEYVMDYSVDPPAPKRFLMYEAPMEIRRRTDSLPYRPRRN